MKIFTWIIVIISPIVLVGSVTITYSPTAHEQWYSVNTDDLANEPTETLLTLEKSALADIVKKVAAYNSKYIENAKKRISNLKWVISVQGLSILVLIAALFFLKRKSGNKHV